MICSIATPIFKFSMRTRIKTLFAIGTKDWKTGISLIGISPYKIPSTLFSGKSMKGIFKKILKISRDNFGYK